MMQIMHRTQSTVVVFFHLDVFGLTIAKLVLKWLPYKLRINIKKINRIISHKLQIEALNIIFEAQYLIQLIPIILYISLVLLELRSQFLTYLDETHFHLGQ